MRKEKDVSFNVAVSKLILDFLILFSPREQFSYSTVKNEKVAHSWDFLHGTISKQIFTEKSGLV